eukprot:6208908-Pleurochrysis_carterae.AAC.1
MAAHELGRINRHFSLRQFLKPGHIYKRKFDVKQLKHQLILKRESLFLDVSECGVCDVEGAEAEGESESMGVPAAVENEADAS